MRVLCAALFITIILALSIPTALSQETTDPCAGVTCSPSATVCPDGTEARCENSCSGGTCSSCVPSCAGHENVDKCRNVVCQPETKTCEDGTTVSCQPACDPNTGACVPCETLVCPGTGGSGTGQTTECPYAPSPSVDFCRDGEIITKYTSDNRCVIGYECKPRSSSVCGNGVCEYGEADDPGGCGPNADPSCLGPPARQGTCPQDCLSGGSGGGACPQIYNPVCGTDGNKYPNDCFAKSSNVGIKCYGECPCQTDVQDDCSRYTITCPDGKSVSACEKCPLPSECREEKDEAGFVHVVCGAGTCELIPKEKADRCREEGGNPIHRTDSRGCEYLECSFGEDGGGFLRPECPSEQDLKAAIEKCSSLGHRPRLVGDRDCKNVICTEEGEERICAEEINPNIRREIEEKCRDEGLGVQKIFDDSGCPITVCSGGSTCHRNMPEEAFEKCEVNGGEMVVKRDENGCIRFSDCVRRGDTREAYYEEVDEVPDETVILQMAFRLEELRIKFDQLAKKTEDIAKYYDSVGNTNDAERFRRVADIFNSIKERIDEIKSELRDRIDDLTPEDISEMKHRLKKVMVSIKDAAYLMLSNSEDVQELDVEDPEDASGCGYDGACFDRAFRICRPTTFTPERGVSVELVGLDGDFCIMNAKSTEAPPGIIGEFGMTCRIPDYSFGIEDHERIIRDYCEGPMADAFRSGEFGSDGGSGGPGGCTTERTCREYCEDPANLEECKRFAEASGFTGPGGCFGQECEEYCMENPQTCMQWCRENPGKCPEEQIRGGGVENELERREVFKREFERDFEGEDRFREGQACVGCLNNNVCDPGECSECKDCLRSGY